MKTLHYITTTGLLPCRVILDRLLAKMDIAVDAFAIDEMRTRLGKVAGRGLVAALAIAAAVGPGTPAFAQSTSGPAVEQTGTLDAAVRTDVAEAYARMLSSDYARPELGERMAAAVRSRLKSGAYDKIISPDLLAQALRDTARSVYADKHLQVQYSREPLPPRPAGPPPPAVVERMRKQNGALPEVRILDGNIGYMVINAVPDLASSREAISAAFAFLRNTDALILDLRGNSGGEPATVAYYMSHLSEGPPSVVNVIRWRKGDRTETLSTTDLGAVSYGVRRPVFVLTSGWTFSGGEELVYDIKARKRGLAIGETTAGGANPGGMQPLGHGFLAFIPVGYAVNPVTGTNWEGVGVQPDVPTSAGEALTRAHSMALDRLRQDATERADRERLEIAALKLKATQTPVIAEELVGRYGVDSGPVISISDATLLLQIGGRPSVKLVPALGGHFRLSGMPEPFGATFVKNGSSVQMILALPGRPPALWRKVQ